MRREEYLKKLLEEIRDFSKEDQEQIIEYFEEMICDRMENGESEETILQAIGSPEQAGAKLRSEYDARPKTGYTRQDPAKSTDALPIPLSPNAGDSLEFITVQAENTKIQIKTVKSGPVQVLFDPREGVDEVNTVESPTGFTFTHRIKKFWFFDVWEFARNKWITVQVPEGFHGRLELITKNAAIRIENLAHLESLEAETSNDKIHVDRVQADNMRLQTSNAPIALSAARGCDLWVKTSNSRINLEDAEFSKNVDVKTSNATIEVTGLAGRSITLHTSNAAVKGWVQGSIRDYDVESKTSNASSTLPTSMCSGTYKKLKVRTSNGTINLRFSKDM